MSRFRLHPLLYAVLLLALSATLLTTLWPDPLPAPASIAAIPSTSVPPLSWRRAPLRWEGSRPAAGPAQPLPMASVPIPPPALIAPPPAEPTRPATPNLPYRFLGRLQQDGKTVAFLALGADNLTAAEGETLENTWRLDRIEPRALRFTHLPSQRPVTLEIVGP